MTEGRSSNLWHGKMVLRAPPGTDDRKKAGHRRELVSRSVAKGRGVFDREVGADHGRQSEAVLFAKNENQMG